MQNLNRNAYFERCSGKINSANPSQLHVDFDPHIRIPPIDHAAVRFQAHSHLPALPTVSSSHRGLVARKGSGTAPVSAHAHCPVARQWSPNVDRRQRRCRGTRQASDDPGDEWGMAMFDRLLTPRLTNLVDRLFDGLLFDTVDGRNPAPVGNYR